MSTNTGKIFNVESSGPESQFETTAAQAQIDAPNSKIAHQIEDNADAAQEAAREVADFAQSKGKEFTGEPPTAFEKLQGQAASLTNNAVAEGKHDVNAAQGAGTGYVEQAKAIAGQAIATAQQYVPTSTSTGQSKSVLPVTTSGSGGIPAQLQAGANSALETAKGYLATAQTAAQPHIDKAKEYVAGLQEQSSTAHPKPATVPSSTAPLETGQHIGGPYPDAAKGVTTDGAYKV